MLILCASIPTGYYSETSQTEAIAPGRTRELQQVPPSGLECGKSCFYSVDGRRATMNDVATNALTALPSMRL